MAVLLPLNGDLPQAMANCVEMKFARHGNQVSVGNRAFMMDRVPSGKRRREVANPTASKVEAALASREEADKLRKRLLQMIVDNEQKRRITTPTSQVRHP